MRVRVCRCVRTGGDQCAWVAQMSFGGHHAKKASDQLQKKLQEEAMADELADNMAGMDVKDPKGDDHSMASASSAAAAETEALRQQNRQAQAQIALMQATMVTMQQDMVAAQANMCEEQRKFNAILSNDLYTRAIGAMQDKLIDIHTLWWIVQWGKEYVARFERDPNTTKQQLESFEAFQLWTRTQKKKHAFGFWASMPKKRGQGDDSFQSP